MLDTQTIEKPLTQVKSKADLRKELDAAGGWTVAQVEALFALPFNELMLQAQEAHKANFPEGDVELATLLSIKTGGCPEDCGYCPQAARYHTDVKATKLRLGRSEIEGDQLGRVPSLARRCMERCGIERTAIAGIVWSGRVHEALSKHYGADSSSP